MGRHWDDLLVAVSCACGGVFGGGVLLVGEGVVDEVVETKTEGMGEVGGGEVK